MRREGGAEGRARGPAPAGRGTGGQDGGAPIRVLLAGLDGAGKTSLLASLLTAGGETRTVVPTVGVSVVRYFCPRSGCGFSVADCGGGGASRSLWPGYGEGADCVLYVVDSADPDRLLVARNELWVLLKGAVGLPVLVACNKQDLEEEALRVDRVVGAMGLAGLLKDRKWEIVPTSAVTRQNLEWLFPWLARAVRPALASRISIPALRARLAAPRSRRPSAAGSRRGTLSELTAGGDAEASQASQVSRVSQASQASHASRGTRRPRGTSALRGAHGPAGQ